MGKEELSSSNTMEKGAIDQMIILDRSIDLSSVLATQLTYEGLIGNNIETLIYFMINSSFMYNFRFPFQMKSMA